jgi:hypothetical protein
MSAHLKVKRKSMIALSYPRILSGSLREFSFPRLIVVPLSSHEIDGVRKEKERLTAA